MFAVRLLPMLSMAVRGNEECMMCDANINECEFKSILSLIPIFQMKAYKNSRFPVYPGVVLEKFSNNKSLRLSFSQDV